MEGYPTTEMEGYPTTAPPTTQTTVVATTNDGNIVEQYQIVVSCKIQ